MIIKVNGFAIQVEGIIFKHADTTGSLGMLNIDIFNYDNYLNPNSSDPSVLPYVHEEIPLLYEDKIYILKRFSCTGMNTRFKHGRGVFEYYTIQDDEEISKHFNEEDLRFNESLKNIKKFNL